MNRRIFLVKEKQWQSVSKALTSTLRIRIIKLLEHNPLNIKQIASQLNIPQSTCVFHINILEKAGLIQSDRIKARKGTQKLFKNHYQL